jgi:transposase-like protein
MKRRSFSDQFKLAAVQRCANEPAAHVARDVGIVRSVLDRWLRQHREGHFAGADAGVPPGLPVPATATASAPPKVGPRRSLFTTEERTRAAERVLAGEKPVSIAKELGIKAALIYSWTNQLKKKKSKPAKSLVVAAPIPAPQPPTILNFCPHCGMPLAAVNRALNAIAAINPR